MEVHFDNLKFEVFKPVVTIGTFDGVHLGHRTVIEDLKREAKRIQGESVIITFDPHPRHIVSSEENRTLLLNTLSEKIYRLGLLGIDHLLVISFTRDFANLTYENFFREILVQKLHINTLLVGYDHKFGKNREGSYTQLEQLCAKYAVNILRIHELQLGAEGISSSKIRRLIQSGEVEKAAQMLSYNYTLKGKIIDGDKIGRTLGFPTANIAKNNPYKLAPKNGVYAVHVYHKGQKYYGMMNIGTRPSVSLLNESKIEVHIFNFDKEIYGDELRVSFIKRIRDERKFDNLKALTEQLVKDKLHIKEFFGLP